MDGLKTLLHSRKFWLAVFAVISTIVLHFFPQFPDAIWQSIVGLVGVLITGIAIEDAGRNIANGSG